MAKKATQKPRKAAPKKKAPAPKKKAPAKKVKAKSSPRAHGELLSEELEAARAELKRLARDENVVRRDLEAALSNERNANDRLRTELAALRIDLKTALADLEIAHAEGQRIDGKAHAAARDLVQANEAQRMAEHAAAAAREQVFELKNENEKLRGEIESLKRRLAPTPGGSAPPVATG
jgi:chromosome segregation ATPase